MKSIVLELEILGLEPRETCISYRRRASEIFKLKQIKFMFVDIHNECRQSCDDRYILYIFIVQRWFLIQEILGFTRAVFQCLYICGCDKLYCLCVPFPPAYWDIYQLDPRTNLLALDFL